MLTPYSNDREDVIALKALFKNEVVIAQLIYFSVLENMLYVTKTIEFLRNCLSSHKPAVGLLIKSV
jgi:hypothetical protein